MPFGGVVDNVLDPDTQLAVGLRVFGDYSLKVVEPQSLIVNLVGTQNIESNDSISDWMREQLMKVFRTEVVSEITKNNWPVLGIAAHTAELEASTLEKVQTQVNAYGIQIARLGNFTISLNDDDATTLKNFRRDVSYTKLAGGFQQYGMGEALRGLGEGAAKGGEAGGNAFLGIGMGMGQFAAGLAGAAQAGQAAAAAARAARRHAPATRSVSECGAAHPVGAKFCPNCGAQLAHRPGVREVRNRKRAGREVLRELRKLADRRIRRRPDPVLLSWSLVPLAAIAIFVLRLGAMIAPQARSTIRAPGKARSAAWSLRWLERPDTPLRLRKAIRRQSNAIALVRTAAATAAAFAAGAGLASARGGGGRTFRRRRPQRRTLAAASSGLPADSYGGYHGGGGFWFVPWPVHNAFDIISFLMLVALVSW